MGWRGLSLGRCRRQPDSGTTIWNVSTGGDYFAEHLVVHDYRVADSRPDSRARSEGCNVQDRTEESEYGKFGWVLDPEGNKVELWEPPAGQ